MLRWLAAAKADTKILSLLPERRGVAHPGRAPAAVSGGQGGHVNPFLDGTPGLQERF